MNTTSLQVFVGLSLLALVVASIVLAIGIDLGQRGIVKLVRTDRTEIQFQRRLRRISRMTAAAEADVAEVVARAIEQMQAVIDAKTEHR